MADEQTNVPEGTPEQQTVQTAQTQDDAVNNNNLPDDYEQKLSELNSRERDVNLKEYLAQKGLPAELFKDLDGFDFEQSKKIIGVLSKHAKVLSLQIAQEKLKQNGFEPSAKASTTTKGYGEMSIKERIALKESDPELYESLLSAYRNKIGG